MKKCTKCLTTKDLSEFSKSKRSRDGHYPSCKQCQKDSYVGLNLPKRNCESCDSEFQPRQSSSVYCSKKCGQKERDKLRVRPNGSGHSAKKGKCEWCEKEFVRVQRVAGKTCGMSCASKLRSVGNFSKVFFPTCNICSSPIRASSSPSILENHCNSCKGRYGYNIHSVVNGETETKCKCCDVSFSRIPPNKSKCCSESCSREMLAKARRKSKSIRSAIKRKSNGGEAFDPFEIFDRDKWHCQMCGISTPKINRGTYLDDAPELDHIIPVSKGGLHTRLNTQCLCRKCNGEKSDKIIVK